MRGSRRQQMWHICPALAIECYEEERQAARTAPLRPSFRRDNRARNPSQPFCPRVLGWYHDFNFNDYPIAAARLGGRAEECDPMELPQTGGCQCGAVRYEITQAPIIVYTCHCTDCQRMTSSAFSLGCVLPDGAFRLVQGEPKGVKRTTGSGRVSTRWVCPGVRRVGLHCTAARHDGAQRAGRHPGRHLLAAADRAHLDPQQAALGPDTRGWSELRDAASRRPLVG